MDSKTVKMIAERLSDGTRTGWEVSPREAHEVAKAYLDLRNNMHLWDKADLECQAKLADAMAVVEAAEEVFGERPIVHDAGGIRKALTAFRAKYPTPNKGD